MSDEHRRKAEALLSKAAEATDLNERSRLIDEAIHWHRLAETDSGKPGASDLLALLSKL